MRVAAARGYVDRAASRSLRRAARGATSTTSRPLFSRVRLRARRHRLDGDDRPADQELRRERRSRACSRCTSSSAATCSSRRSRPGGQPANLQGIWNEELLPAWGSKWTTNINLEMNYWLADAGDLWETQEPLWSLVRDLRVTGADTARVHYGAKGWVLHHNTDLWRATAPVDGSVGTLADGIGCGSRTRCGTTTSSARTASSCAREAYPAMKGAAEFALDLLVTAPAGHAGRRAARDEPLDLAREPLPGRTARASRSPTRPRWTSARARAVRAMPEGRGHPRRGRRTSRAGSSRPAARLPPLQVGARGQLQEWIEDYPEAEPAHRHVSHLYALYPGQRHRRASARPRWPPRRGRRLELRGDGGTGWAAAWRVGVVGPAPRRETARTPTCGSCSRRARCRTCSTCTRRSRSTATWAARRASAEMLVQSTADEIRLLPALPKRWTRGRLTGVRVRGGATVDITWKDGELTEARVRSDRAARYRVSCNGRAADVVLAAGTPSCSIRRCTRSAVDLSARRRACRRRSTARASPLARPNGPAC